MVAKDSDKPEQNPAEEQSLANKVLKVAAYPIAAIAGLWTAKVNIADGAYDRLKEKGGFADIYPQVDTNHRTEIKSAIQNISSGQAHLNDKFASVINTADKRYHPLIEKRMKDMGIGTLKKQFDYVGRGTHQTALINGVTIAAVTIGALLTIANSKTLSHLFEKKDKNAEEGISR